MINWIKENKSRRGKHLPCTMQGNPWLDRTNLHKRYKGTITHRLVKGYYLIHFLNKNSISLDLFNAKTSATLRIIFFDITLLKDNKIYLFDLFDIAEKDFDETVRQAIQMELLEKNIINKQQIW